MRYLWLGLLVLPLPAYAVLPYIFANQPAGNVPASYLDTDFSLVEGGIVQPVISTGSANAYSVAPAIAWVGGYSNYTGLGLLVNFNAGNTGPSSINVSGLGAANLVKNVAGVATALSSGDVNTNVPYLIINDGSQFWVQNVQGSTSAAAASTTTVQYNNGGSLAGSNAFTFISGTGVISVTGVSASTISVTQINGKNIALPCASFVYDMVGQVTIASSSLITAINRRATGLVDISGSFPSIPRGVCTPQAGVGATNITVFNVAVPSATTAGFEVNTTNGSTGAGLNSAALSCYVMCQ